MLRRSTVALSVLLFVLAGPALPATVTTPQGRTEVFSRAELLDVLALLQLVGAEVVFARAAGSYTATLGDHEVQFTPGGSLAVVNGTLTPLAGPIRALEGHLVAAPSTLASILGPLGWTLMGSAHAPQLVPISAGERLSLELLASGDGPILVISGSSQKPRLATGPAVLSLDFPSAIELAQPFMPRREVLGAEVRDNRVLVHLAPGVEVAGSYSMEDPPRYVIRLVAAAPRELAAARRRDRYLVVLDPGHGGDDHGARGPTGAPEKEITLAVARMAAGQLESRGITTRLTRDGDHPIPLVDRTTLANRVQADAFVSIHANSSPARAARGAETYFMSLDASDSQAAAAAERENAAASPDVVGLILWDLAHVANLNASSTLAREIQRALDAAAGLADRGVRQAPFVVLTGATMPAALVEVGFLSNPEEASRLSSAEGQAAAAIAIAEGIVDFLSTQAAAGTARAADSP